ncbi:ECF RNA polymerase sigma factor SigE [Rosistilla oblonga]|uniref:ECF RNA polymerase sigma factor SigE n=2 Tax=Rosistilla oblonga TaxID=2527990 RepID=A0A518IPS6_9BACT|nr:ECF RNA polymerase sigma factor SigE [Rosistilla oblonga]QDV55083.1 ECF RNA polymerase sigma factor SigE [Rosistilla oblonga]
MQDVRSGDPAALDELLALTGHYLNEASARYPLPANIRSKLSDSDLVQNTLLEIAQDLAKFRGTNQAAFLDWAQRTLRNNFVDARRKFHDAERRDVRREVELESGLFHREGSPSRIVKRAERDEQLEQAIAALPDRARKVIELRNIKGMSWEAVGDRLDVSADAARKLWTRAVKRLQEILAVQESSFG